jgi:DNA polymerase elongation subunit (family B)
MLNGHILDSYVDNKKNIMITWIINKDKAYKIEDAFEPTFFVYSSKDNLFKLASQLLNESRVNNLNFTKAKIILGSDKEYFVLEIKTKHINSISKIAQRINESGNYQKYNLYNVDIRLPTRYLQSKGVFFNAKVKSDGIKLFLDDEQWAIDYEIPNFKTLTIEIKRKPGIQSLNNEASSIWINEIELKEENEADTILSAVKYIQKSDPDIIFSKDGDSFVFPYIYHRAVECGINKQVNLGRDNSQNNTPTKQSKSYFSYGQIVYRPPFYTLKGRAHIDIKNSFMYKESSIRGLLDISRCSNIPLQLQSRVGPGTSISQIQINKAMQKGYLIPWKKNMPEQCKTARQLLISDRGGLILSPKVGLHDNVTELDFSSLYPNIMLRYNISPETILCNCCNDSYIKVPQLGYHICTKQTGLLPEVLKPIITRRFLYKARAKNKKYNSQLYKDIQQAWKWILIVCFGYTGYRNARFGRIECHESITAFARDILLDAVEIVEKSGYKVLHGIVDSLWIKKTKECIDPLKLSRRIGKKSGIHIDVKGVYNWIVFLPSKQYNVGALNRYYGLFDNGDLKVRGVELRQRNTPDFLREVQQRILDVLSQANNSKEFMILIPKAVTKMLEYGKKIMNSSVKPYKLVFETRISKGIKNYKVNNLVKSALLQMRDLGFNIKPGQSIRYIVLNENTRDYKKRVKIVESIIGDENVDVDYYLRQIAKCVESILVPFGYTLEKLISILKKLKYQEITDIPVLPRTHVTQSIIG